jgi:hypothetical protein
VKAACRRLVCSLIAIRPVWLAIEKLYRGGETLYRHLYYLKNPQEFVPPAPDPGRAALVKRLFGDRTVKHGPFRGMKYPELVSAGSEVYPKLLGSYEKEIHPLIENLCAADYSCLLNVGCAEGYYAVGFALKGRFQEVQAFDLDPRARTLCQQMAEANGVTLTIRGECFPETLAELKDKPRTLVLCDCEGFEKHLFTEAAVAGLKNHDVLIETHDFVDIGITDGLRRAFSASHDMTLYESRDDILKAYEYEYPELQGLSLEDRRFLLEERRPAAMRWLFCAARRR